MLMQIEFPHDEPATFPGRTRSGSCVKLRVVRALSESHEMFKRASTAADKLVGVIRLAVQSSRPPIAEGQQ